MNRLLPAAALLLGLLLLPACDNQSDQEVTRLRASLQSWQAKYDTLSTQKTRADQQADDEKTRADALAAERDDLKNKLTAATEQVSKLQAQVTELKKAPAPAAPVTQKHSAPAAPDVSKVLARLEGVAADLYTDGNYNAVNAILLSASDLGSKDPQTFYQLGYANASVGRYADAAGWYEKALTALDKQPKPDPGARARYLNNYGVALAQSGKTSEAVDAYLKALGINPAYTPALYNLALIYSRNAADHDKAIDALRKYIANGGARSVSASAMLEALLPPAPAAPPSPAVPPTAPSRAG